MNFSMKTVTTTIFAVLFLNAVSALAAPSTAPMVELKGFAGRMNYDAILTVGGKLTIKNTEIDQVVYTTQLNTATLNQFNQYAYSLGNELLQTVTTHQDVVCMMMPFEGSDLSVAVIPEDAGHQVGRPLRLVLSKEGCWVADHTQPKDAYNQMAAQVLKALMLSLANQSGLLPSTAYSFMN